MPNRYKKQIIGLLTFCLEKFYNSFLEISYVINYHPSQNFEAAMLNRLET